MCLHPYSSEPDMKGQNSSTEMIMKGQNPEHRVSQMLRTAGRRSWGEPENSQSVC